MPTSERSWASLRPSAGSTSPSIAMVPESIGSSRLMVRHSVDLPEPDGPRTTTTWPRSHLEVDVLEHVQAAEVLVDARIEIIGRASRSIWRRRLRRVGLACRTDLTQVTLQLAAALGQSGEFGGCCTRPYHWVVTSMATHEVPAAGPTPSRTYPGPHLRLPDERARLRAAGRAARGGRLPRGRRRRDADVVVFNTCAVRENADNKLYGNLSHLVPRKEANPGMQIAVGGCLAQKDRDAVAEAGAVGRRRVRHAQHRLAADAAGTRPAQQEGPGRDPRVAAGVSRRRCPPRANPPMPLGFRSRWAATTPARSASCPRCAARRPTAGPATSSPRCSRWSTRASSR